MTMDEKIEFLEEVMELEEGDLDLNASLEQIEEWDSLTKLALMAEVKKKCGKTLSVDELKAFKTVKDICDYLE